MLLKSYFAATVEEALRKARRELGEDAMLVSSHRSLPESAHLGAYEVVLAVPDPPAQPAPDSRPPTDARPWEQTLKQQIQLLRQEIARLSEMLDSNPSTVVSDVTPSGLHPWAQEVYAEVLQAGIDSDTAHDISARLDVLEVAGKPEETAQCLRREIARYLAVEPPPSRPALMALVGPPGSGKTLLAEKLASWLARNGHVRSAIIAYGGSRRIWGWSNSSSTRTLDAAANATVLSRKLNEHLRQGPVIIDTPGLGPAEDLAPLSEALEQTGIETHLVLPATVKGPDMLSAVRRFAALRPARIALTHLEESTSNGHLVTVARGSRLPVTFLSSSQDIGQLEVATAERLVSLVLGDAGAAANSSDARSRRAAFGSVS